MMKLRKGVGALSALAMVLGTMAVMAAPASASHVVSHVVCGQLVTTNITLTSDLGPCPADGLIVVASNVTVNLNGFRIFAPTICTTTTPPPPAAPVPVTTCKNATAGDSAGVSIGRLAAPGTPPITALQVTGVTVQNGTIEGFDAGVVIAGVIDPLTGEVAPGGGSNTVQNLVIQNNVNDQLAPPCNLGDGIAIFNSNDNRILNNQVLSNGPFGGISVIENSDRNLISGNVVLGQNLRSRSGSGCGNANQDEGIRIEGPGANDNIVVNNRVEGSGLAGIGLHGFVCGDADPAENEAPNTGTVIRRNTVVNNEGDGISFLQQGPAVIVCPAYGSIIERNISSNNGGDGIFVAANSHDNVISHNVTSNNADAGIRLNNPRFRNFTNVGPTLLDLVSPNRAPYVENTDYRVMSGSGSGDVTARLVPIDINIGGTGATNTNPVDTSTSGCTQADYAAAGFQAGDIALIQRGTCTFMAKVNLAIANGASAVIMFNEGQTGRTTFAFGSVGPVPIPVISTTFAVGRELYNLTQAGTVTIHVVTNTTNERFLAAPAPYDNTLIGNRGSGNGEVDGYDGNLEPPCDNNKWRASRFGTVNQPCVVGAGGSGTAKGRTGVRPGNPDHGKDVGTVRGGSAGSNV